MRGVFTQGPPHVPLGEVSSHMDHYMIHYERCLRNGTTTRSTRKGTFAQGPPNDSLHCKKRLLFFPSPAGMSLTKLSLAGTNLTIPGRGEFG